MTVPILVSSVGPLCVGSEAMNHIIGVASAVWPGANRALYVPLYLPRPATVVKLWWLNGAAVSGNVDVGIYNATSLARIVSSGSTAQAGTSVVQEVDIADTALGAGVYLLALSCDNTTAAFARTLTDIRICRSAGVTQEAAAFALPVTATPATAASAYMPVFGASLRTLVA